MIRKSKLPQLRESMGRINLDKNAVAIFMDISRISTSKLMNFLRLLLIINSFCATSYLCLKDYIKEPTLLIGQS